MADPAVIVESEGPVLVVTLNRPEKKNAVNCEVMCRLYDAWVRLDQEDALRVAILTGRGDTFCAGMDLGEIGKMRSGVAGMSMCLMPSGETASTTALITAAGAPIAPISPTPFTPNGFMGQGVSVASVSKLGRSPARGSV